jgi:general secretion pathway protein G
MLNSRNNNTSGGYSLVEVMIVMAIITTIAAIAIPSYNECINHARVVKAISEIRKIQSDITLYQLANNRLPNSLGDLGLESITDPWGKAYQYNLVTQEKSGGKSGGKCRKDKALHPINSDYDLYSMGRDGKSQAPLTAKVSRDDIVRASNGGFIGLADNY